MASLLVQEPVMAVDTESNSLYAYREQVCLLQFSTPQNDYLVDPLALHDLSPLARIIRQRGDPKSLSCRRIRYALSEARFQLRICQPV